MTAPPRKTAPSGRSAPPRVRPMVGAREDRLRGSGARAEDDESAELVAQARAAQHRIHGEQADRALIRDRRCDEND